MRPETEVSVALEIWAELGCLKPGKAGSMLSIEIRVGSFVLRLQEGHAVHLDSTFEPMRVGRSDIRAMSCLEAHQTKVELVASSGCP